MSYAQLTQEQRYQIYVLKKIGQSKKEIANIIGVHASTIGREISRNSGLKGYRPKQAHQKSLRCKSSKQSSRFSESDWLLVKKLLRLDLSPEQISGRFFEERQIEISHEWIYQYIYKDKLSGGNLYLHLRCKKMRKKRYGSYDKRGQLRNRISIEERPSIVDQKKRVGDWEGDTISGAKHKGVIATMVERKTLFTVIEPLCSKNSSNLRTRLVERMIPYKEIIYTITLDNGKEFAEHQAISRDLDTPIYFAHPYASWERGLNENTNGLIRQYFPKKKDLSCITREDADFVMNRLNFRPRKCLGFKTPYEVLYNKKINLIALES